MILHWSLNVLNALSGSKENDPVKPMDEFTTPIGVPEIVSEGKDITVVSYGSTFNICQQAVKELKNYNVIM